MTPPIIIALSGLSGAGKSTVAEALAGINPSGPGTWIPGAVIRPFAQSVKGLATGLAWDGVKDAAGRRLLETLTMMMEDYRSGYWARRWAVRNLGSGMNPPPVILVPDHRGVPGFDALIDAHGDKDGKGFRFTIGFERIASYDEGACPANPTLAEWDSRARDAGIYIENAHNDFGASAARAILSNMKERGFNA